jgi:hypothetical protein
MRLIFSSILLFLTSYSFSQVTDVALCDIFKEAVDNNSTDTLDYYLEMDDSQLQLTDRINLMTFKGFVIIRSQGEKRSERRNANQSVIDSSYQLFTDAIDLVEDENLKIEYRMRRFETLSYVKNGYPTKSEDQYLLNKSGYREDKSGFAFLLTGRYSGGYWLGAEVSLFSGLQVPYNLKDGYGNTVSHEKVGFSGSAFVFSYTRNLSSTINESKFSLIRIEAPIYIDILQFGWVRAFDNSYWFYRPQIGVGYGRYSLSYGFNLYFRKEGRDILNRHSLDLKTKFIF